jgi:AbrB family looped-hinge helix DNA binding protein
MITPICHDHDAMKEITTTMTRRGQVTVPAEVRKMLGLVARDKVTFIIEEGQVRLSPASFTLESAFASVPTLSRPEDVEEQVRIAKEERAQRLARKLAGR